MYDTVWSMVQSDVVVFYGAVSLILCFRNSLVVFVYRIGDGLWFHEDFAYVTVTGVRYTMSLLEVLFIYIEIKVN